MLCLISIGLNDEKDMSIKALEAAKRCGKLYLELYTDNINTSAAALSKLVGKKVEELPRKGMEDDSGRLIEEAGKKDIGIFIGGDALSATTHIMLAEEARKAGVGFKVIHGSSIITAVAETGLQLYKFGRTVTLTKGFEKSILDGIEANMKAGLHTLILLDIGMTAKDAAGILSKKLDCKAVAACRLGSEDSVMVYGDLAKLSKDNSIDKTPAVVCIPGKLHFMEEEFLEKL
jgi:diphthine synthase